MKDAKDPGTLRRPNWLNKKISISGCGKMDSMLKELGLNTVCREASCPNISECFGKGIATFLILGRICTRGCAFCGVKKGAPLSLDPDEVQRVTKAVIRLKLKHVVITSVTRDDLSDGGAGEFARLIRTLRDRSPETAIEVLVPDFQGDPDAVNTVLQARPDIFAHNVETVPRLYPLVRIGADFERSLKVLSLAKAASGIYVKSGIMAGLGETREEVLEVMDRLRLSGCDFLSIGQYLRPGKSNYPVQEYIEPNLFAEYEQEARSRGFSAVESAPYVRSSYAASRYLQQKK